MASKREPPFAEIPFSEAILENVYINKPAVEKAAKFYGSYYSNLDAASRAKWALTLVHLLDYTTLSADNTDSSIRHHCTRAAYPIGKLAQDPMVAELAGEGRIVTGAVCVYPSHVRTAAKVLGHLDKDGDIEIAAVATGFPSGQYPLSTRLDEIRLAIKAGATEIDIVVDRTLVVLKRWRDLYDELVCMRQACGTRAHMKTILAVGECGGYENVYKAAMVAMMAGSDFIKTSTGKEAVNATLPFGLVMMRAIRVFGWATGRQVGIKPAGGIQTFPVAMQWAALIKQVLGASWLTAAQFRIGASGLLDNLVQTLDSALREMKQLADKEATGQSKYAVRRD